MGRDEGLGRGVQKGVERDKGWRTWQVGGGGLERLIYNRIYFVQIFTSYRFPVNLEKVNLKQTKSINIINISLPYTYNALNLLGKQRETINI